MAEFALTVANPIRLSRQSKYAYYNHAMLALHQDRPRVISGPPYLIE